MRFDGGDARRGGERDGDRRRRLFGGERESSSEEGDRRRLRGDGERFLFFSAGLRDASELELRLRRLGGVRDREREGDRP